MSQLKANIIFNHRPRGLMRLLFRLPIWLYRLRLGWLLGNRCLMLTHVGRKSGLPRTAVIEIVRHDKASNTYYIASGWGEKSDWYRNVVKTPRVRVQVGRRAWAATAQRLSPEAAEELMLDYARRHPRALRELARVMGYRVENNEEDYRALGRVVPILALRPVQH